jgi:hypothetical protein
MVSIWAYDSSDNISLDISTADHKAVVFEWAMLRLITTTEGSIVIACGSRSATRETNSSGVEGRFVLVGGWWPGPAERYSPTTGTLRFSGEGASSRTR